MCCVPESQHCPGLWETGGGILGPATSGGLCEGSLESQSHVPRSSRACPEPNQLSLNVSDNYPNAQCSQPCYISFPESHESGAAEPRPLVRVSHRPQSGCWPELRSSPGPTGGGCLQAGSLPWLLLGLRSSVAVGWSQHFPAPDSDLSVERLTHGGWLPSGGTSERGHSLISKVMSHYFCHLSFVRVKSLGSSHT